MKTIYILIGNDKQNKETFAQNLTAKSDVKILSDNDEMTIEAKNAVDSGKNIIINTSSKSHLKDILTLAKDNGYLVEGDIFLTPNDAENALNTKELLEEGYHRINVYKNGVFDCKEEKPLIASSNLGKIAIYAQIFKELNMPYCSLRDLKIDIDVEENGKDELENAMIKAKAYHEVTGLPVLCNDSGLVIEKFAPEDQPGVFVRRYGGRELSDEETIEIFSEKLKAVGGESDAYFNVGIVLCDKKGEYHSRLFKSYRYMLLPASKTVQKGLPLRSLDYSKQFGKYMSEMTIEEANASEGDCIKAQEQFIKEIFG